MSVIKKICERKKGELKKTKKVFKLTHDWANLTANWAPMNDSAEDIKERDQDVSEDRRWIFCIGTDLLCDLQQVTRVHIQRSILKSISSDTWFSIKC